MNFRTLLYFSKKAVTSGVAALAFLMATQTAFADFKGKERKKDEVAISAPTGDDAKLPTRATLGEEAKVKGPSQLLLLQKQSESDQKLDALIVQLTNLLQTVPDSDSERRPSILFNLAEAYWQKSKSYKDQAYAKQDDCNALGAAGDAAGKKRCDQRMEDLKSESDRLRDKTIEFYKKIVNNYPTFENLDAVLYYLAANLQEIGRQDESIEYYKELYQKFSQSKFIPNVLIAFGDYYFYKNDMDSALKAYDQVQPGSSLYAYAQYKKAWCYFNLDQKDRALEILLDVLKLAQKDKDNPTSKGLIQQTRKDIVMVYSFVGNPNGALKFFKKVAPNGDEWLKLTERLAVLYSDKAKTEQSNTIYNDLIKQDKNTWKVLDYQYEIITNQMINNPYSQEVAKAVIYLLIGVQKVDQGKIPGKNDPEYKAIRKKIEQFVRSEIIRYHREAQTTKNDDLYVIAFNLYKYYIDTFPNGPESYTMTFFYGELLYRREKWEEAAKMYEKALQLDPKGKYTNDAVHGLVLAYFKLIPIEDAQKDLSKGANDLMNASVQDADSKGKKSGLPPIPQPKPIPELVQHLIDACKLYIQLNPNGKEIVDVKYTMARKYYDYDHLKEAIPLFKEIAYDYPTNPLAIVSANLELDAMNQLQDFDELEKAASEYLSPQGPIKDELFYSQVRPVASAVRFVKCSKFEEQEKWKDAAQCFMSFYREFKDNKNSDKALYNAALDFEHMKDLPSAIAARIKLVQDFGDSNLVLPSMYNVAANFHAIANYESAAGMYENYAEEVAKSKSKASKEQNSKAQDALANAASFRQGLGDYQKSITDYKQFLKMYGKQEPEKAAKAAFQIAKIYQDVAQILFNLGKKSEAEQLLLSANNQYKAYIKKYSKSGSPDQLLEANTQLGLYEWRLGDQAKSPQEAWKYHSAAVKQFKKTISIYDKMSQKAKASLTTGLDAVSQCQFQIAELDYLTMSLMKLDSKNESELKKKYKAKNDAAVKVKGLFEKVLDYQRPDWSIAALYRIGNAYENFANALRKSTVPRRLTYDQKEIYRGILEDYATQIEASAITAYQKALEVAQRSSWFNDYSRKAETSMAQLRPEDYTTPSEKRSRPIHMADGLESSKLIKQIEDQDRLEDLNVSDDTLLKKQQEDTTGGSQDQNANSADGQ